MLDRYENHRGLSLLTVREFVTVTQINKLASASSVERTRHEQLTGQVEK